MTRRYVSPADTAKALRQALKAAFPAQKFSVRTSVYSGGASIDVRYVDGPKKADVETIAQHFAGASFDGMIDLKSYHTTEHNGEEVRWGADFVFVSQEASDERRAATEAALRTLDDLDMNNLEAKMGMGRFGPYASHQPMTPENSDWRSFVQRVAIETLYA